MKKIFVVIPAFNEETIVGQVIANIRKSGYKNIIVVDDGSADRTYAKARDAHAHVLHHILNRGKGAAARTGIEAAKLLGADTIVTFDGDGQHDPKDIRNMLQKLEKGYDVVLGTRNFGNKKTPPLKAFYNRFGNFFVGLVYGLWVQDSQCGLRAYSKRGFSHIDTRSDRYEYESEVIREIAKHKLKYTEVPVKVLYTKYSQAKTEKQGFMNGIKTIIKIIISQ